MPWKTQCAREQRLRFLKKLRLDEMTIAGLCRRVGISRKTAYKWLARFEEEGSRGLVDRSRQARVVHNRPEAAWLSRIRRERRRNPTWGGKKLRIRLRKKYGEEGVPSVAAINRWLRCWKLAQRPARRGTRRGPLIARPHLTTALRANDVWSADFKGWFRTGDGTPVHPLTVQDMATRYLLAFELLDNQSVERAQAAFQVTFQQYGLPAVIRVDNGCPFGADGALGLTRLSAWWIKLGIRVEFITPGCPGENAAHEQMHGVYKAEEATPPAPTRRAQKGRTKRWAHRYNHERPHEALSMRCPAELYRKSRRKLPAALQPARYPKRWMSRLVKGKGMISLLGKGRFVGEAFERERVGLKPTSTGWNVYFYDHLIGTLSARESTGIYATRFRTSHRRRLQVDQQKCTLPGKGGGLRPPAPPA